MQPDFSKTLKAN